MKRLNSKTQRMMDEDGIAKVAKTFVGEASCLSSRWGCRSRDLWQDSATGKCVVIAERPATMPNEITEKWVTRT